jgi:alcohol dehydrogenase class IV
VIPPRGEFVFLPQERVLFGAGTRTGLSDEMDRLLASRALVLTGRSLASETPVIGEIEMLLGSRRVATFARIGQHTPEGDVAEAARIARDHRVDLLLSVGGGSPIDAAKAVARRLGDEGGGILPQIAIPTTLSAAEFSHLAGYTDEASGAKTGFSDPRVTPRVVILDPEVTLYTPAWLWASSGIRSLDHAVETLYSPGYHPLNDILALEAISSFFSCLPASNAQPDDLDARLKGQLAAWMSFFAPASVKMGLSHRLGRLTGASYGVPHGITSCIYLPLVMEMKADHEAARLAPIARRLGLAGEGTPDLEAAIAAAEAVAGLVSRLGLPQRLRDVGVPRDALAAIAAQVKADFPGEAGIDSVLERAW